LYASSPIFRAHPILPGVYLRNMTNHIDLALVNQRRAARFDPCSNTGAIDSKSGRHPSSVPCFAELRAPVGLSTTRLWRCNEFVLPAGTDGSRTRHRVKLLRLGSQWLCLVKRLSFSSPPAGPEGSRSGLLQFRVRPRPRASFQEARTRRPLSPASRLQA